MTIKKQPQIRFGGFGGDWEEKKLKDLVGEIKSYPFSRDIETDEKTGFKYIHYGDIHRGRISVIQSQDELPNIKPLEKAEYLKNGDIVVADVSEDYEGIANPCVIACDLNENVIAGLHTIAMRPQQANPSYLYYLLKTEIFKQYGRVKGTGIKVFGITKSNFFDFECLHPTKPEQISIGQFFRQLDEMLTLAEQKHAQTVQLKKAMLGKLFPISGSLQPQIRLKGFSGDWVERKLGDLVNRVTEKNKDLSVTLPLTISAQYGLIAQNIFFDKRIASRDTSNYYVVKNGDFAYNKSYSQGYPWGAIKRLDNHENGLLSSLYIVFTPTKKVDSQFLVSYYDTDKWYSSIEEIAVEGARNHGLLNVPTQDFFETKIRLPETLTEQTAIGKLFQTLDHTIALQAKEITQIKQLKSALLGKMFV